MGAYKYLNELWKHKQSDVLKFVNRIRNWEMRQLPAISRVTKPTRIEKARALGYKAKQGIVIYRIRIRRGGRKRPVKKGRVYGKPSSVGVTGLKNAKSIKSIAEERVGRKTLPKERRVGL